MTVLRLNRIKKSVSFDADQHDEIEAHQGAERRDFGPMVEVLCREALHYRRTMKTKGSVEMADVLAAVLNIPNGE